MGVQMVIKLSNRHSAQTVINAVEIYKTRLKASIRRTRRKLAGFEHRYNVTTEHFLANIASEDLEGGDLEYVEWAGEDKLLVGLETELRNLENAHHHHLPQAEHKHTPEGIYSTQPPTLEQVIDEIIG